MSKTPIWRRYLRFLGSDPAGDVEDELSFHLATRMDDLMSRGLSESEAREVATQEFGNVEAVRGELEQIARERLQRANRARHWESLGQDLGFAARTLRKNAGFTIVTLLTLGLGIGANTSLFSVFDAVMLKPLPVVAPVELVHVTMENPQATFTNPIWEELRDRQEVFSGIFAYAGQEFDLAEGGQARPVVGNWVSGEFFPVLGIDALAGRLPGLADDHRGCSAVAALSHSLWQREYGGDPQVIGSNVSLNGHRFQIIGVTPPGFSGLDVGTAAQVFAPLCARSVMEGGEEWRDLSGHWFLRIMGRRKNELTAEQVHAELARMAPFVFAATLPPDWDSVSQNNYLERTLNGRPAGTGYSDLRLEYGNALMILMGLVGVVLLIACASIANLLFARGTVREREIATRLAVGAPRGRILRQLLMESLLLSLLGGAAGLLFAHWTAGLLVRFLSSSDNPVWLDLSINLRVLAFTAGLASVVALLFGLAPSWRAARVDPHLVMKSSDRSATHGVARRRVSGILVSGQVALSFVLLTCAALLVGTFAKLTRVDPGFTAEGVLLASLDLRNAGYSPEQLPLVKRGLLDQLRRTPNVASASASEITPLGGTWNATIKVDSETRLAPDDEMVYFNAVSDGYFRTLGTPLLRGRDFDQKDRSESPPVAVINESLARRFFGDIDPVGRRMSLPGTNSDELPITVVGVVGNTKYESLREAPLPVAYFPLSQGGSNQPILNLDLRSYGDPSSLIPALREMSAAVNPRISIRFANLSEEVAASLARERLLATLSGFFGGLALLLVVIGVYGTMTYSVNRRHREFGIRLALGATGGRLVQTVLMDVARPIGFGLFVGAAGALLASRVVATFLYDLSPADPTSLALSTLLLAAVAFGAGIVPALKVARFNPVVALQGE
jgi:putative ABC transport system permease protein